MEIVFDRKSGMVGNHKFQQPDLLRQALTHKSVHHASGGQRPEHYERLEFLGDSVLGLIVSDLLWKRYPEKSEGDLSRLRAQLVNEEVLSSLSRKIELNRWIIFGNGERDAGGADKDSILADVVEAVVGALYVDGGLVAATEFVTVLFGPMIEGDLTVRLAPDFKTELQELTQSLNAGLPSYRLVAESGPAHNRQFEVEVWVAGRLVGGGVGSSKKRAEQAAAERAFQTLVRELSPRANAAIGAKCGVGDL